MEQVKWKRVGLILVSLGVFASTFSTAGLTAFHQPNRETVRPVGTLQPLPALVSEYHGLLANAAKPPANLYPSTAGGIHEQVPKKCATRYQHWKQEFLATETGRQQWAFYQNNP